MRLYFVTGNTGKYNEVKAIIPDAEQLDIDVPEIQSNDPQKVIEAKLQAAASQHDGRFIIEDTSLYLDALNGLPGPLIKWFEKSIGTEGISNLTEKLGNDRAQAKTIIGLRDVDGSTHYFEGVIEGRVVTPRGDQGFGWDPIFTPDGHDKTFAEMSAEVKNELSMRRFALEKLKAHL